MPRTGHSFVGESNESSENRNWYAIYTRANHEKRVARELRVRCIEHFLPLYRSMRRWSDRRVVMELPLFPGYVFVRIALQDQLHVLQISGVVRMVCFNGVPTVLPGEEIEILRKGLSRHVRPTPHPFLSAGRNVRIKSGPLEGLKGILLRTRGNWRVVVSVALIHRAIVVDVDFADVDEIALVKKTASNKFVSETRLSA